MEKFDFNNFGLGSCQLERQIYFVCVDGIVFKVYGVEFRSFIEICLGSGLDVQMKSVDNKFLNR